MVFLITQDLKEIAKELGLGVGGKKDELVATILASSAAADADGLDDGLGDAGEDVVGEAAVAGEQAGSGAGAAAAAPGKHASIVFALEKQQVLAVSQLSRAPAGPPECTQVLSSALCAFCPQVTDKKANIVGIKTLSDTERAQLRAAK